jgi:hypothetical protein
MSRLPQFVGKNLLKPAPGFCLLLCLVAQTVAAAEYETRIKLDTQPFGVNEVVFRWTTDASSGVVSVANLFVTGGSNQTITNLAMKVDDQAPSVGGVFEDFIVIDGVIQDLEAGDPGPDGDVDRALDDVIFEFDLDSMEVLRFRNLFSVSEGENGDTSTGTVYKVEGSSRYYELISYGAGDRSWLAAKLAAEAAGGQLAVLETAAEEAELIATLAPVGQVWVGGYQDTQSEQYSEPGGGWFWLDEKGLRGDEIATPYNAVEGYSNWNTNEPNQWRGNAENWLTVNFGNGWNDTGNPDNVSGYIVEFGGYIKITQYEDGNENDDAEETPLQQRSAQTNLTSIRNLFIPLGEGTCFDIDIFEQECNVVKAGYLDADACLALDLREPWIVAGGGRPRKGVGGAGGAYDNGDGGKLVYNKDELWIADLAGIGTCTGLLLGFEQESEDPEVIDTWEKLLAKVELSLPKYVRGYQGEVTFVIDDPTEVATEETTEETLTIRGVWLNIVIVRTNGVEYDGAVATVAYSDNIISYANTPEGEIPACNAPLDYRTVTFGGTNPLFGEPENIEGNVARLQSAQCNRSWSLTRRSTHIEPLRIVARGSDVRFNEALVSDQLSSLQTLLADASCIDSDLADNTFNPLVENAVDALALGADGYEAVRGFMEDLAILADASASGFDACPSFDNYRGDIVARAITAAFTTWDRLLHPEDGQDWAKYEIPCELEDLIPDLRGELQPNLACTAD